MSQQVTEQTTQEAAQMPQEAQTPRETQTLQETQPPPEAAANASGDDADASGEDADLSGDANASGGGADASGGGDKEGEFGGESADEWSVCEATGPSETDSPLASAPDLLAASGSALLPASVPNLLIASGTEMPIGLMCAIRGVILGRK